MIKRAFLCMICVLISLCCACGCRAVKPQLEMVKIETAAAETLDFPVMVFTHEEAVSLLERFAEEKRADEQRRAALIQTGIYSAAYFRRAGRISWGGWSWTWYSERILPGFGLRIPGRHTDANGYVRDGNGYLCLASDVHKKGTVLETPFGGYGRVYDCGCVNSYTIDVYVGW